MSDTVSFAELDRQHVELLPARTVLSMFSAADGGVAGDGTDSFGGVTLGVLNKTIPIVPGTGMGSAGANANG
ncbi:MAG: hypothetical protein ACRDSZ_16395 [Pseudonocardiaceae bacterium]